MKKWQRDDYDMFLKYINQTVKITYGEIKIDRASSMLERMLFNITVVD